MKTLSPLVVRGLALLLVAGSVASVVLRQNSLNATRAENQALLADDQEAQQLAKDNAEIPRLRGEVAEADKLREQNSDLLRLRSEAGQMRKQTADLEQLRAANQQLQAQVKGLATQSSSPGAGPMPGFIARKSLRDAGQSTPEKTIETFFWAMTKADSERIAQCFWDTDTVRKQAQSLDWTVESARMAREFAGFPGYRVAGMTNLARDEVEAGLQTVQGGVVEPMKLKFDGNQWKIEH